MLQLLSENLPDETIGLLQKYQDAVDLKADFVEQAAEGKKLFSSYNKKTNKAFKEVRNKLAIMSGGTIRCNYCEDSNANQLEHIYPKNFYPERCFVWENYCYACGPCNQPKSDKFAIFEVGTDIEKDLKKDVEVGMKPPAGIALLLDPRRDQPLDFLFLDTKNTFKYVPFKDEEKDVRRADYTIEILGLNSRSYLVRSRIVAFGNYRARLYEYVNRKEAGESEDVLKQLIESLKSEHHKTVWYEMIRQRSLHSDIDDLLTRAPEALTW
jgi:uncharacterized protein (TIGR02646 family)